MERNLDRRVEALCRVRDAGIVRHIRDVVLDAYLRDTDRAYVLSGSRYEPAAPAWPPRERPAGTARVVHGRAAGGRGGRRARRSRLEAVARSFQGRVTAGLKACTTTVN